jgi:chemotaxis protein MotB
VSYADFITLLFAFFVLMYANSQSDKSKAKQLSEAVSDALSNNHMAARLAAILGGVPDDSGSGNAARNGPGGAKSFPRDIKHPDPMNREVPEKTPELTPSLQTLTANLQSDIQMGKIRLSLEDRGLVISLNQAAFFPSGADTIEQSALPSLEKIAAVMQALPNSVRLEGHTDSRPVRNSRFRNNWELSSARAIAVLDVLTTKYQIDRRRLAVSGYAETASIDSNETEEGRARNRRVDIVVLTDKAMASEPSKSPAPTSAAQK